MPDSAGHGGGDLGRRIAEQRARAGLSREETAARAGMAPGYLRYLETSVEPNPSQDAMVRLAGALGTTAATLGGAGISLPPGQRQAATGRLPEVLSPAQCQAYLEAGGIGRFLFVAARGPVAMPVNYRLLNGAIIFRTRGLASMTLATQQPRVSFEVDRIDDALGEGWSVLVSGAAHLVTAPRELSDVSGLGITPWAGGERGIYVSITARDITGRRIRVRPGGAPSPHLELTSPAR